MLLDVFGTQEALDEMSAVHPIGRIGRPEEIADAVAWLFSDKSSYYTGQSLTLDGGLTAQRPYVTQSKSAFRPRSNTAVTGLRHNLLNGNAETSDLPRS